MKVFGLETSGRQSSIALLDGETVVFERELPTVGRRPASSLFPLLSEKLRDCNLSIAEIDRIAISSGPGSFTGLRIGFVFAKVLAYAIGAETVPIETFRAIAANTPSPHRSVLVVRDAQREAFFVQRYDRNSSDWEPAGTLELATPGRVEQIAKKVDVVSGEGVSRLPEEFLANENFDALPDLFHAPRASVVARLGEQAAPVDPYALTPLYGRQSAAEEKAGLGN